MMKKIKLFIFDMDGLLVDSERFYSAGWKIAMESLGYELPDSIYDSWIGQGKKKTMGMIKDIVKEDAIVDTIVNQREVYIYDALHSGEMTELAHASKSLDLLKNKGYLLGVSSSTERGRGTAILEFLNLYQYIDFASFGDDVSAVKPSPEVYQRTLDLAGVEPHEAIAVEDSYTGALSAAAAGMKVIVVPYVTFEVDKIRNIENVLVIADDLSIIKEYATN